MIDVLINRLFPRYLFQDKNGYALIKALEAGLEMFLSTAQTGLNTLQDPDEMPEWRLDEAAWEYNIPYDYAADVETKRNWIRNAILFYSSHGTAEGMRRFLEAYFDGVQIYDTGFVSRPDAAVEEFDPFTFKVKIDGGWTPDNVKWLIRAIQKTKNVRSVMSGVLYQQDYAHKLYSGIGLYGAGQATYNVESGDTSTMNCYADEDGAMLLDENGFPLIVEE